MLLVKLFLVPTLIWFVTFSGRRWGTHIAGWLSAFPVVGAPILFLMAYEHGIEFARVSALGMFSGIAANIAFSIVYAWLCRRMAWFYAWPGALIVYALLLFVIYRASLNLMMSIIINFMIVIFAPLFFPPKKHLKPVAPNGLFELLLRMMVGVSLLLIVTGLSAKLGAQLSGMLAMFPVMASVLAIFTHRYSGSDVCIELLRGALLGWYAFSTFSLAIVLFLPSWGVTQSFVVALLLAAFVQFITLLYMRFKAVEASGVYEAD